MAYKKDIDCGNTTQCICLMARGRRIHGSTTPQYTRTNSTRSYERIKSGHPVNKKERQGRCRKNGIYSSRRKQFT